MDINQIFGLLVLVWLGVGLTILYGMWMAGWKYFIPFIVLKMVGLSFIYSAYLYLSKEALEENYIYIRPLRNYILAYTIISSLLIAVIGFDKLHTSI